MGTYRTHFILNNLTPYKIANITTGEWDKGDFDSDDSSNPNAIKGSLEAGEQKDWPLELVMGKADDPFNLRLDFGNGHWLCLRNFQKQSYQDIDNHELPLSPADHNLAGLDVKVYRQCQKKLPKPDWGSVTVTLLHETADYDLSTWMSKLPGTTPVCDINLPGTHDSAAIAKTNTPYACQHNSITEQLMGGVRLLDVRIKIKGASRPFHFVTCHGNKKYLSDGDNEYQDLPSLLDECKQFLTSPKHKNETIVMSLKIDDDDALKGNPTFKAAAIVDLTQLMAKYNTNVFGNATGGSHIPTLAEARGKICLLNRIDPWDSSLGASLHIDENMSGYVSDTNRGFKIYCQDKYSWGDILSAPNVEKFKLVKKAWEHKKTGEILINFASGVYGVAGLFGLDVNPLFLNYLGSHNNNRPKSFGWMFFDFALDRYSVYNVVDLVVSSNFNYDKYPNVFHVNKE